MRNNGELNFLKLISDFGSPNSLCIDVGANRGAWTKSVLDFTKFSVLAIEPLVEPYSELAKLEYQYPNRLSTANYAMAEFNGLTSIYVSERSDEHATISKEVLLLDYLVDSRFTQKEVNVSTLDTFFGSEISGRFDSIVMIKLDTEGSELEVLKGASKLISQSPPLFIQLEHNSYHLFRSHSMYLFGTLLPGYKAFQLVPTNLGLLLERNLNDPLSNIFMYSNFIFVRQDLVSEILYKLKNKLT
jgi:FkbM family methyltransferase